MKVYGVSELAKALGVHRQSVNYWLKKGWVKAKLDYRNRRVFTPEDLKKIRKWRSTLREA